VKTKPRRRRTGPPELSSTEFRRADTRKPRRFQTRDWALAAVVAGVAATLYFITAARDIVVGDGAEFITVAAVLGVPHPPGYPLFTMLGHIFSLLPLGPIPFRVNLMSVVCDSLAVGIVYLSALRLTSSRLAAMTVGLVLMVNPIFWTWSLSAEVFPLNNLLTALLILLLVTWHQKPESGGILVASFFVAGAGLTNQQTIILLAPAFVFILWQGRSILRKRPRLVAIAAAAFIIGLLPYFYIPWASSRHPAYNWGNISSLHDFISFITRRFYGSGRLVATIEYLGGSPIDRIWALCRSFGLVVGVFALLGVAEAYRRARWYCWFSLIAFGCTGPLFAWISNLNLKTTPAALFVLERFFLMPLVVVVPLVGFGVLMVSSLIRRYASSLPVPPLWPVAGVCLVASGASVIANYQDIDQSRNFIVRRFCEDIFRTAEPGTIFLTAGDAIVFPMTYLQTVEGLGSQITLINLSLFSQPWYVDQLRQRYPDVVFPFNSYDGRANNLKLLADANPGRRISFAVTPVIDDGSLYESYWPYQHGLLTVLEPKSKGLSFGDLLSDNKQLLEQYRPPAPGTVKKGTFESYILLAYAWPEFQIGGMLERAGAKDGARQLYQHALEVDPDFDLARNALAGLEH